MKHWPPYGIRVLTPRLEMRLPTYEELDELADLAEAGIHEPGTMPFARPWSLSPTLGRDVVQRILGRIADWTPEDWALEFVVFAGGRAIGTQGVHARDFGLLRETSSGSWLGLAHQGQGYGTEMRAAMLHFVFAGLGAESATTGSHPDNPQSIGVTRKLGYEPNGMDYAVLQGRKVEELRFRLTREAWERNRSVPVEVEGLTGEALGMFGVEDQPL